MRQSGATRSSFGAVPGVVEGERFVDRRGLYEAGVHRQGQAGIVGRAREGAESIVLSGGYEDDDDHGDLIIYTGQGGRDPATGKQIADQELTRGNLALAVSAQNGIPVRVIRGHAHRSQFSPPAGYQYAGLYRVASYWEKTGRSGFLIWRYRLEKITELDFGSSDPQLPLVGTGVPETAAPRQTTTIQRIIRNSAVGQRLKQLHDFRCQICGIQLVMAAGPYIEAAHIRPLGRPHDGPDHEANMLILCPNHHALFDLRDLAVTETFQVIDTLTGDVLGELRRVPGHVVDSAALAYHGEHIAGLRHLPLRGEV